MARYGVYEDQPGKGGWFDADYSDEAADFNQCLPIGELPKLTPSPA